MNDIPRPVMIRSGRNPYEVWIAVALLVTALYSAILGPPSKSVSEQLDVGIQILWAAVIMLGALTTLVGLRLKNFLLGLRVETIGQILMCLACIIYFAVVYNQSSFDRSGIVLINTVALGLAAGHRTWQIRSDLKEWIAVNRVINHE